MSEETLYIKLSERRYRKIDTLRDPLSWFSTPQEGYVIYYPTGMISFCDTNPEDGEELFYFNGGIVANYTTWDTKSKDEKIASLWNSILEKGTLIDEPVPPFTHADGRFWYVYIKPNGTYKIFKRVFKRPDEAGLYWYSKHSGYNFLREIRSPTNDQLHKFLSLPREDIYKKYRIY